VPYLSFLCAVDFDVMFMTMACLLCKGYRHIHMYAYTNTFSSTRDSSYVLQHLVFYTWMRGLHSCLFSVAYNLNAIHVVVHSILYERT
jgi:hypothetical protein